MLALEYRFGLRFDGECASSETAPDVRYSIRGPGMAMMMRSNTQSIRAAVVGIYMKCTFLLLR
jgi:hypothetical protein